VSTAWQEGGALRASTAWQEQVDALRESAIILPGFHSDEGEGMLLTELLSPATLEWLKKVKERTATP
jgi:hypothetical protein